MAHPNYVRSLRTNPNADESPDWDHKEPVSLASDEPGQQCYDNANATTDDCSDKLSSKSRLWKFGRRYEVHASALVRSNVRVVPR